MTDSKTYEKMLTRRPLNVRTAFPDSRCAMVSGRDICAAARARNAIVMAANIRNPLSALGIMRAARRADSFVMLELAKSEGRYTGVTYENLPQTAASYSSDLGDGIVYALHMDHYAVKSASDRDDAARDIPRALSLGWSSVAIDASHNPDFDNLSFTRDVAMHIPQYIGLEVEVGEIKGAGVISTVEEAVYFVGGLNSWGVFPDYLAISNGSKHGTYDASLGESEGIDLSRTGEIASAIRPFGCVIAQHGISGTPLDKVGHFKEYGIHKGNVGTLWQNIVFGLDIDPSSGNAFIENGSYVKRPDRGVPLDLWEMMVAAADARGYSRSSGDYKNLNRPFHALVMSLPAEIRERIVRETEEWALRYFEAFNSVGTATAVIEAMAGRRDWNPFPEKKILTERSDFGPERAPDFGGGKGPDGKDYSD